MWRNRRCRGEYVSYSWTMAYVCVAGKGTAWNSRYKPTLKNRSNNEQWIKKSLWTAGCRSCVGVRDTHEWNTCKRTSERHPTSKTESIDGTHLAIVCIVIVSIWCTSAVSCIERKQSNQHFIVAFLSTYESAYGVVSMAGQALLVTKDTFFHHWSGQRLVFRCEPT